LKIYRDGREVCQNNAAGDALYEQRTMGMVIRQERVCCICQDPKDLMTAENATFEHGSYLWKGVRIQGEPRGMGGARRDDRIVDANGNWINGAAHGFCNAEKGSRR
jgi:hypothetical protein